MKKSLFLFALLFLITNLYTQEIPKNLSDADKIYGLSKVWKEADKNFVYFDQIPALDWDKTYQEYIPKVLATTNTYDYYKQLQAFCSLLEDGHSRVVVPWQLRNIYEVAPPMSTELINGKVVITKIYNDTLLQQGIKPGMEIKTIDGLAVQDYATQNIKPYVFYSTPQDMDVQIYEKNLLRGPVDKALNLTTANGQTYAISRKLTSSKKRGPIYTFKVLDGNIGYLKISRFWGEQIEEKFDTLYPEIQKTSKLIIDVSNNSGGNSGYAHYVLSHFVDQSFETSRWKSPMYIPAYASWGYDTQWVDNFGEKVEPVEENKRYTKPVVVLISEKTYSAGEDFVSAFLNTNRGKVLGRATAGTTGNPIGFALPGGGGMQICSKRDYLSTGKEFVGFGIPPTREVAKTAEADYLIQAGIRELKTEN